MTRRNALRRLVVPTAAATGLSYHAYGQGVRVWAGYWEYLGRVIQWVRR